MRLLFCVNRDIYANLALNHILPHCAQDRCKIFFSDKVGRGASVCSSLDFLKFYEQTLPNQYLFPLFETLPASNTEHSVKTFQQLSRTYDVPMQAVRNINAPETLDAIAQFQPDAIISIRFGQILKEAVIQQPRYGVINLHSGLLPNYRGILATFWSMLHEQTEYGFTLHTIHDATIDTGHIIQKTPLPIDPNRSLFHHILQLYPLGAQAILETLHQLRQGNQPETQPQDSQFGNYYGLPTAADFDEFLRKGYRLLDEPEYFQHLTQFHAEIPLPNSSDFIKPTVHATV